jgi:hypothetical protein
MSGRRLRPLQLRTTKVLTFTYTRSVSSATVAFAVIFTCAVPGVAEENAVLGRHVRQFIFHGRHPQKRAHDAGAVLRGLDAAVRDLSQHTEVPICLEALPASHGEAVVPVEINAENVTIKDILDELILQNPRYAYRERHGLIEVFPNGADRNPTNCLNMIIPAFKQRAPFNGLLRELRIQVAKTSGSAKNGVVRGGSALAHPPPDLIEVDFSNRTVREILSLLSAKVGNMAWSVRFHGPEASCDGISIHVFQPRVWSASDSAPLTYSEGLPKKCLRCHYHKPPAGASIR